ncbi:TadE-like protein [Methylopila sp. Yamaguchi]|nr:TadE-like protein [Methylopila sp. Yamaguchi]
MRRIKTTGALRRLRQDARGSTAVEFALIGPVLLLFVFGTIELGLMMAAQHVLDDAVFMGSRTSKTGYVASTSTQTATVAAAIRKAAQPYLDPGKIVVTSKSYPDYSSINPEPFTDTNKNGVRDAGEPYTDVNGSGSYDDGKGTAGYGTGGQIVVFTATYAWPVSTPMIADLIATNGVRTLSARAVVRNEPYGTP